MVILRGVVALWAVVALGCGLRSDPLIPVELLPDDGGGSDDGDAVDPDRIGSCNDRLVLPTVDAAVSGELARGGSLSEGTCGRDDGPEDAYVLLATSTTDVQIIFDASTEFDPVLRVELEGCGGEGIELVCDRNIIEAPFHFLVEAGLEYTVTVDSKKGQSGNYAFDVVYGAPALDQCPVHPEFINQVSGATFVWGNTFSPGHGRIDGFCGGPGRENMFPLTASYPGFMYISATGTNGFSPVVSFRTGCGATSELGCARDGDTGIPGTAELEAYIDGPGQYYIVVDEAGLDGGDYSLRVEFE
ncbi:MAG: hypothetical protein JKY37_08485 [Nannocystaceae bacterium]|nr:hypothetical protein [Nannocystaceae bacterium]